MSVLWCVVVCCTAVVPGVTTCTVNVQLDIGEAAATPSFSQSVSQYAISATCAQFTATSSIVSGCDNCQVSINGNSNSQVTFDATSTNGFGVEVCLGACSSGIYILYTYTVSQGMCRAMVLVCCD